MEERLNMVSCKEKGKANIDRTLGTGRSDYVADKKATSEENI